MKRFRTIILIAGILVAGVAFNSVAQDGQRTIITTRVLEKDKPAKDKIKNKIKNKDKHKVRAEKIRTKSFTVKHANKPLRKG
jgi:hypothetical protein